MKRITMIGRGGVVALLIVSAVAASGASALDEEEWDQKGSERRVEVDVDKGTVVDLHLPPGEMFIDRAEGESLTARMVVRCESRGRECERLADDLEFLVDADDDRVDIDTRGWKSDYGDSGHILVEVEVPAVRRVYVSAAAGSLSIRGIDARTLDVQLKAGEVRIRDGVACPRVDLLAGAARVEFPERLAASVHIDAGIGEAVLVSEEGHEHGRRSWLLGSEVNWDRGEGDCDVDLDIQVGEGRVELRE